MADPTLGELIFGTPEEQRLKKANVKPVNGYTGRPPTQFEQFISNANSVKAAGDRLLNSGPLNSNFFRDVRTRQLGFSCDTNTNAPPGTTICTGAQMEAIKTYDRGNSNAVVAQRYRDNQAKSAADAAKAIALKPAYDYSAEIVRTATPELKESIRRDMIKKGLLHPLETTWNSNAAAQLINYYSGPSTLGSSERSAAQAAANLAQVGKDTRTVSYDPADMRAEALQRRALANNAKLDDKTNIDNQNALINAVATPIIEAQRKEAFPVYDALANAVKSQSKEARGASGKTPVASKKKNKKVARPSVSKLKKKNR
jgi:hypothetical protein